MTQEEFDSHKVHSGYYWIKEKGIHFTVGAYIGQGWWRTPASVNGAGIRTETIERIGPRIQIPDEVMDWPR